MPTRVWLCVLALAAAACGDDENNPVGPNSADGLGLSEHDILTGSNAEGTLAVGLTCADWTSASPDLQAQVGHSDGLGVGGSTAGTAVSWNAAHVNGSCANTAPRGGAGRLYCFAVQ